MVYAQQPAPTFELAMCNMSDYSSVFVALRQKQDAQKWTVSGWYPLPDRGCAFLGRFQRDAVYYYAKSDEGVSWSPDANDQSASTQCVDQNKYFQGAADVGTCPAGQIAVRFRMLQVPTNMSRRTWTLTGSK
jgi:uncharacterized membrane protein